MTTADEVAAADRTLTIGSWTITIGAVVYSVLTVTPLMAGHTPPGWIWTSPILPLVVDSAVIIVTRLDAALARLNAQAARDGIRPKRAVWPFILRWITGLMTLVLNVGDAALAGDLVGVGVHMPAPLLLIVNAEAALAYRRAIATAQARIDREQRAKEDRERAERMERERLAREERERERARREHLEREAAERDERRERAEREHVVRLEREAREHAAQQERERAEREEAREQKAREHQLALERERLAAEERKAAAERAENTRREEAARQKRQAEEEKARAEDARQEAGERERPAREQPPVNDLSATDRALLEQAITAREREQRQAVNTPVNTLQPVAVNAVNGSKDAAREHPAQPARTTPAAAPKRPVNTRPAKTVNTQKLPEHEARKTVHESFEADLSVREAAELTGWSVGWVSARYQELKTAA